MSERPPLATLVDDSSNIRVDLFDGHVVRIWQLTGGQVYMTLEQLAKYFSFAALRLTEQQRKAGGDES